MVGTTPSNVTNKRNLILGVVAIIVVIAILYFIFSISTFTTGEPFTACVANSGYLCQNAILNSTTSNLTVTLGQNTGSNWNNIYFVFVLQGTQLNSSGVPQISFSKPNATYLSFIKTGDTALVNLTTTKPGSLTIGQGMTGTIWAKYTINDTNQTSYAQIAAINIKVS